MQPRALATTAGVALAALIVAVIVLLVDVANLSTQVSGLQGADAASGQYDTQFQQLQSSMDLANQDISGLAQALAAVRTATPPPYEITCPTNRAGALDTCRISAATP
jgi:hypothetical protein